MSAPDIHVLPQSSKLALAQIYDVGLLDLDGVVWHLGEPIAGAAAAISLARESGMRVEFVTNNASRRAEQVAQLLTNMEVSVSKDQVVTSAQAAAALLAERLPSGTQVLIVGAQALAEEIEAVGLYPVWTAQSHPAAVVQGYGPQVGWEQLAEATVAIAAGAYWVATNSDTTLPSARGPLPGNGALIAAVQTATGRSPDAIAGKPYLGLHTESVKRSRARQPLVVGDRLDTDIAGANRAGVDSLLVLTGVTTALQLLAAPIGQRPTYIAEDLTGLNESHPPIEYSQDQYQCMGWEVKIDGSVLTLGLIKRDADVPKPINALRVLCAATWAQTKQTVPVKPTDPIAQKALLALNVHSLLST